MEIERQFIIDKKSFNQLKKGKPLKISQSYLAFNPEVRVREINNKSFLLTIKGDGLLSREEVNIPLEKETYKVLLSLANKVKVKKETYENEGESVNHVLSPKDYYYFEKEFDSEKEARKWTPNFIGIEVTGDPLYRMKELVQHGINS